MGRGSRSPLSCRIALRCALDARCRIDPGNVARPFHRGHADCCTGAAGARCHRAIREDLTRRQAQGRARSQDRGRAQVWGTQEPQRVAAGCGGLGQETAAQAPESRTPIATEHRGRVGQARPSQSFRQAVHRAIREQHAAHVAGSRATQGKPGRRDWG